MPEIKANTRQVTHFADDATLVYIAKLERDRARLVAALKGIIDLDDGDSPDLWHYEEEFNVARALLRDLEEGQ